MYRLAFYILVYLIVFIIFFLLLLNHLSKAHIVT